MAGARRALGPAARRGGGADPHRGVDRDQIPTYRMRISEPTSLGEFEVAPNPLLRNPTISFAPASSPPAADLLDEVGVGAGPQVRLGPEHGPNGSIGEVAGSDPRARAAGGLPPSPLMDANRGSDPSAMSLALTEPVRVDRILLLTAVTSLLVILLAVMVFADFFGEPESGGDVPLARVECAESSSPAPASKPERYRSSHEGSESASLRPSIGIEGAHLNPRRAAVAKDMRALSLNLDVHPKNAVLRVQAVPGGYSVQASAPGYTSVTRIVPEDFPGAFAIRLERAPATLVASTETGVAQTRGRPKVERPKAERPKARVPEPQKRPKGEVFLTGGDL